MITLGKAVKIARNTQKYLVVSECVDIGDRYAFSFETADGEIPPGTPVVCVAKNNGRVTYMSIPPLENLDILNGGNPVDI